MLYNFTIHKMNKIFAAKPIAIARDALIQKSINISAIQSKRIKGGKFYIRRDSKILNLQAIDILRIQSGNLVLKDRIF